MKKIVGFFVAVFLLAFGSAAFALDVKVVIPKDERILPKTSAFGPYSVKSFSNVDQVTRHILAVLPSGGVVKVVRRVESLSGAGSEIVYTLDYKLTETPTGTVLLVTSRETPPTTSQDGLFGKFPVPKFTLAEAVTTLSNGSIDTRYEFNSEFPVESAHGNFKRLARGNQTASKSTGSIDVNGQNLNFVYEVVPYRSGAKVIVLATIPAPPVSATGEVDFKAAVDGFGDALRKVVEN